MATVLDESGRQTTRKTDGLGRLTEVVEDPGGLNYKTVYTFDVLDNLRTAKQFGNGSTELVGRTFDYL